MLHVANIFRTGPEAFRDSGAGVEMGNVRFYKRPQRIDLYMLIVEVVLLLLSTYYYKSLE